MYSMYMYIASYILIQNTLGIKCIASKSKIDTRKNDCDASKWEIVDSKKVDIKIIIMVHITPGAVEQVNRPVKFQTIFQ